MEKVIPIEDRFIIIDVETGEILDDANGYGYKTAQKAYKGYYYKKKQKAIKTRCKL